MDKRYSTIDLESKLVTNYAKLNEEHRREMLNVARLYMPKIEIIRCPKCPVGDGYNEESFDCVECWYNVLDDICRETIKSEGWTDGE